jgi:hypothetical protein
MLLPDKALGAGALEKLRTELGADDAVVGHQAIWALVGSRRQSVPFLKEKLGPQKQ